MIFFFQAEDGIRDGHVTGVQTCALPIFIIDIGLRGFLPASLVEMRRVRDLEPYIGQELEAKIIELDKQRNNVVLSRRAFLEQTQSEVRSEFLHQLQKGQVRKRSEERRVGKEGRARRCASEWKKSAQRQGAS